MVRQTLFDLLVGETDEMAAAVLAEAVADLDPKSLNQVAARQVLLELVTTRGIDPRKAAKFALTFTRISVTPKDEYFVRRALLTLITRLGGEPDPDRDGRFIGAVVALAMMPEDRAAARQAILARLARETDIHMAWVEAEAVAGLSPVPEDRASATQALLALIVYKSNAMEAAWLVRVFTRLDPSPEQQMLAAQALLALLAREISSDFIVADTIVELVEDFASLDPSPQNQGSARQVLLALLTRQVNLWDAQKLAAAVVALDPSPQDLSSVRQALLALLSHARHGYAATELVEVFGFLDPSPQDQASARQDLLALLTRETDPWDAQKLAAGGCRPGSVAAGPVVSQAGAARSVRPLCRHLDSLGGGRGAHPTAPGGAKRKSPSGARSYRF